MEPAHSDAVSKALGVDPIMVCASDFGWISRPRLWWLYPSILQATVDPASGKPLAFAPADQEDGAGACTPPTWRRPPQKSSCGRPGAAGGHTASGPFTGSPRRRGGVLVPSVFSRPDLARCFQLGLLRRGVVVELDRRMNAGRPASSSAGVVAHGNLSRPAATDGWNRRSSTTSSLSGCRGSSNRSRR